MIRKPAAASVVFLVLCIPSVQAQLQPPGKTILDSVYSDAQATRGEASYKAVCGECHGDTLQGVSAPELTGNRFIERWREDMLDGFYNFIREKMPKGRPPDAKLIPAGDYLDILTYILKMNGYRAGQSEMTPGLLESVMFVGKDGPQPVPDGSLITTVGCLSEDRNGRWILSNATEPARTRTSTTSTSAELKASLQKPLGALTFRLTDLEAVSDFAPDAHQGHKMQAKGFLIRQPNAERISLSSMEMLDSNCGR